MITSEHINEVFNYYLGELAKKQVFVNYKQFVDTAVELTRIWANSQGPTAQDKCLRCEDADTMGDSG